MNQQPLWMEGVSDAIGFSGSALPGFWIVSILGLNIFSEGYGKAALLGIVLVGLGGGLGLQLAWHWRRTGRKKHQKPMNVFNTASVK